MYPRERQKARGLLMFQGGVEMERWPNMGWEKHASFLHSCKVFTREEKLVSNFSYLVAVLEKKGYENTREPSVTIFVSFFSYGVSSEINNESISGVGFIEEHDLSSTLAVL